MYKVLQAPKIKLHSNHRDGGKQEATANVIRCSRVLEPSRLALTHPIKETREQHEKEREGLYYTVKPLCILNQCSRTLYPTS